jgi:hypothetical protein
MTNNQSEKSNENSEHTDKEKTVRLRVQTPRGLWSMDEPKNAPKRPKYSLSAKVAQVIEDARDVFKFVEQDSKYKLMRGKDELQPERTLASYKIEDDTLLVLTVQGGNA